MSATEAHIIYGQPPRGLVEIAAVAQQCSPLMPGSARLEDYAPESLTSAVIYAPPGTIERRYVLALALQALGADVPLIALAPKDKGGNRIAAELAAFGCEVAADSRSHHRILHTKRPAQCVGLAQAIADGALRKHDGLWTQPGIFSWDRLDPGSALLLKHLPELAGQGADFGCGLGILSRAVLESPAVTSLALMDMDRRAIEAAERNITDPRTRFHWADVRSAALPNNSLDFVVMNPPFHEAGVEDQTLGQQFIARAAAVLKRGGVCWLTANRHLPYEALLSDVFTRVALMEEADGFKIYRAEK